MKLLVIYLKYIYKDSVLTGGIMGCFGGAGMWQCAPCRRDGDAVCTGTSSRQWQRAAFVQDTAKLCPMW